MTGWLLLDDYSFCSHHSLSCLHDRLVPLLAMLYIVWQYMNQSSSHVRIEFSRYIDSQLLIFWPGLVHHWPVPRTIPTINPLSHFLQRIDWIVLNEWKMWGEWACPKRKEQVRSSKRNFLLDHFLDLPSISNLQQSSYSQVDNRTTLSLSR